MVDMTSARRALVHLALRLFGMNIKYWRTQVESLWALNGDERQRWLAQSLAETAPKSSEGLPVRSLDELKQAPPLTKAGLWKQSSTLCSDQKRVGRHTAGTTGYPTHIWLNKDELARMLAVRDYCFNHYGIELGDREARVWGRPQSGWKSALKDFLMNRRVFHPAGKAALEQVKQMLACKPAYIYGYASLILEAARLVEKYQLKVPEIKCVICTAETVLPSQKAYISQIFSAPVAEEYGSTEFDVVAFECRSGHRHLVNPWLLVEAEGDDMFISDIGRSTQNLIRYIIGDTVKSSFTSCSKLGDYKYLQTIEGRSIDRFAYVSESEKFHAVEFAKALDSYFEEAGVHFGFQVEQVQKNNFVLMVYDIHDIKSQDLLASVRAYIKKNTGYEINLRLCIEEADVRGVNSKRSYFVKSRSGAS